MIADEEENKLRWCGDKHKGEPLIQSDTTLEERLGEPADANAGMQMRPSPSSDDGIHRRTNDFAFCLGSGAELLKQVVRDFNA